MRFHKRMKVEVKTLNLSSLFVISSLERIAGAVLVVLIWVRR